MEKGISYFKELREENYLILMAFRAIISDIKYIVICRRGSAFKGNQWLSNVDFVAENEETASIPLERLFPNIKRFSDISQEGIIGRFGKKWHQELCKYIVVSEKDNLVYDGEYLVITRRLQASANCCAA